MRLLLVANGASIHTERWVLGLKGRGHEVALATDVSSTLPVRQFPLDPLKRGRVNFLALAAQVRAAAREFRPQIVHAHYVSHYGLLAAAARVGPLVASVWGADVEVFPRRHAANRRLLTYALARAAAVTATSRHLAGAAAPYLPPGRRAVVVPFGVDAGRFRPSGAPPADPPLIVCNKHLEPDYGPDVLVDALACLAERPWQAELLGDGSARPALAAQIARKGLGGRVRLVGRVAPDVVLERLQAAAVAVYPSRRESFGVATLEAEAVGVPVIASRVGGLPEVLDDGATGWLVDPDDPAGLAEAIHRVLDDPAGAEAMGRRGRQLVEQRFSWEAALAAMEGVYAGVAP